MILVPLAEASGKLAEASGKLAEASGKLFEASLSMGSRPWTEAQASCFPWVGVKGQEHARTREVYSVPREGFSVPKEVRGRQAIKHDEFRLNRGAPLTC